MTENDLKELYDTIGAKLRQQNGYVVDYNPAALTAILGCHSNTLLLGSSEQSKAASHYVGPYVDKNKTPLGESIEVVSESMAEAKIRPSIAEDTGTKVRLTQHVLTKILNKLGTLHEVFDTQAVASLLGLSVSVSTESFCVVDTQACINFIKNAKKVASISNNNSTNNSSSGSSEESDSDDNASEETELDEDEELFEDDDESFINDEELDSKDNFVNHDLIGSKKSGGILQSLLDMDRDTSIGQEADNLLIQKIQHTISNSQTVLRSPQTKFLWSAYGSCPLYTVDDGKRIVPVPYPYLYANRGEQLKQLNRIEYYSVISVQKDRKETSELQEPHLQYKGGRKKSKRYRFSSALEIHANHHQALRSRQCTPNFFRNTPPHPGKEPIVGVNDVTEADVKRWRKKADKFAEFYLMLFRPETDLYSSSQINNYSYK
eukprot:scaffold108916_cov39-Cyclotella_meneghiniana.AAC.1